MKLKIFALAFGAALALSAFGTSFASPPDTVVCYLTNGKGSGITVPLAVAEKTSGQLICVFPD